MKKALTITIAGTLFTIEEDAYSTLDAYLRSIQAHFGADPDKAEILKDIEARIAEQLMERKASNGIVTISVVEAVIAVMGTVEDFDESASGTAPIGRTSEAKRRLYRNPDDMIIAGVCSGLAAYFGIDTLIVRLVFVALVLLGFGVGIVLYIIMALVIPKAETAAEKLQMKGGPITLSSFKGNIGEQVDAIRERSSGLRIFFERLLHLFGRVVRFGLRVVRVVVGVGFLVGALCAAIAATFALVNLAFNAETAFVRFPVAQVASAAVYHGFLALGYTLFIIPVIFVGAIGLRIIRKKKALNLAWITGLGALWVIALIIFGSMAVRQAPVISERIQALPENQSLTKTVEVPDFSKLDLKGSANVRLVQGSTTSVVETGSEADIERMSISVDSDTLVVSEASDRQGPCIFCIGHQPLEIVITSPGIHEIKTSDAISLAGGPLTGALTVVASDASRIELEAQLSSAHITLTDAAHVAFKGAADVVNVDAKDAAGFEGFDLNADSATVTAEDNTRVEISAQKTLKAAAHDVSMIIYDGNPNLTKDVSDNAEIVERATR